jgi:hypothetical protein
MNKFNELEVTEIFGQVKAVQQQHPWNIFDERVLSFIGDLAQELKSCKEIVDLPDLQTFAFWARKNNLSQMKIKYGESMNRRGLGVAFHITPSNVPTNFLYSLVFGLLSGNANIIRLTSKAYPQIKVVTDVLNSIKNKQRHLEILDRICLIRYEKIDSITESILRFCDIKILWGSDETLQLIRGLKQPVDCRELLFIDKHSISLLSADYLIELNQNRKSEYKTFIKEFYRDAFLFDQNGCSSPTHVYWVGSEKQVNLARKFFWQDFQSFVKLNYTLDYGLSIRKFTEACKFLAQDHSVEFFNNFGNWLYLFWFNGDYLISKAERLRFGSFTESRIDSLAQFANQVDSRVQTVTYKGFKLENIMDMVRSNPKSGIDRIVPVGTAISMDINWDGMDVPLMLSKQWGVK